MEGSADGAFYRAPKGQPKALRKGARPTCLLARNLHMIYFSVMCNLEVCGIIFDHNNLTDISV